MTAQKPPKEIRNKDEIANRKVAVYFNMASMSPVIELHLAVVKDLLSRGNKVTVYACDQSFKSQMDNPFNRKSIGAFRMFRIKDAIEGLDIKFKIINLEKVSDKVPEKSLENIELGVMSSFASMIKVQNKSELKEKWLRVYDDMFLSAKKLYNYFVDEIEKEKYDFVFMFNGRFGDVKPALEATRNSNVAFGLYEMKKSIKEIVFVNELVHSIEGNSWRAFASYEADKKSAEENAKKFFNRKTENKETGDPIYTKAQKKGELPEAIVNTNKKVIAIYPTTDDEYKFIGKEWDGVVPESQVAEIDKLASTLLPSEYIIVVKMHPNQKETGKYTLEQYFNLEKKHPHVIVERPISEKDTYALMERADVIVTFASTMGVEACYAGKPVVLIGDTNWGKMNVAHQTYSGAEAGELIKKGIKAKPRLGAIIWGNYVSVYRDPLPEFQILEKGNFFVSGRRIGKSTWRRILQLPAKLEITMNRPGFSFGIELFLKITDTIMNIVKGKWTIK